MYITKINLKNFQKHEDLTVELVNGINAIVGASGVGKTCVIRALRWVFNDLTGDFLRKEGTKKTSVSITLDDGTIITRVRSDTVNRYILEQNGTEKQFDSCGRKLPEEIALILNLPILKVEKEELLLNVHTQLESPFLLGQTGTYRSKVLNALTGNDVLDKTIKGFNKDLLEVARESRNAFEEIETKTSTSENLNTENLSIVEKITLAKKQYAELEEQSAKLKEVVRIVIALENNEINTETSSNLREPIPEFNKQESLNKIEQLERVKKLIEKHIKLIDTEKGLEITSGVQIPEFDKQKLIDTLVAIEKIELAYTAYMAIIDEIANNMVKTVRLEKEEKELQEKHNKIVEQMPTLTCPKCGTEFKEKNVL